MPRKKDIIDMVPMSTETRERKFVAALMEGSTITDASAAAGVSRQTGSGWTKKQSVIKKWNRALAAAGITDELIANTYRDGLTAEKREQMPDGHGGVTVTAYPDHRTRLLAAHEVMEWSVKLQGIANDDEERAEEAVDTSSMETTEVLKLIVKKMRKK